MHQKNETSLVEFGPFQLDFIFWADFTSQVFFFLKLVTRRIRTYLVEQSCQNYRVGPKPKNDTYFFPFHPKPASFQECDEIF